MVTTKLKYILVARVPNVLELPYELLSVLLLNHLQLVVEVLHFSHLVGLFKGSQLSLKPSHLVNSHLVLVPGWVSFVDVVVYWVILGQEAATASQNAQATDCKGEEA